MATSKLGFIRTFRVIFADFLNAAALESFIPGFALAKTAVLTYLGFDLTGAVGGVFLCVGFAKVIHSVWKSITRKLFPYVISTVLIPRRENSHEEVLSYVAKRYLNKGFKPSPGSRTLILTSTRDENLYGATDHMSDASYRGLRYDAATTAGSTWFFRNWRLFSFQRSEETLPGNEHLGSASKETVRESRIALRCLGWSTEPLQSFVDDCWAESVASSTSSTTLNIDVGLSNFEKHILLSRDMSTIDLDKTKKDLLIDDIAHYLKPSSRKYYADRGIPLRRGYLFYGPPGTGKTSMSLTLAGKFGLPLYIINVGASRHSPETFSRLFRLALPSNCIVLLEDIDSAGIRREGKRTKRQTNRRSNRGIDDDDDDDDDDDARGNAGQNRITLSVLLNAIDGIGSSEGRVLIMTTNNPENLDSAVKRPGRIDLQIYFGPATKETIELCFLRMYRKDTDGDVPDSGLQKMAHACASKIPTERFTPAEVQEYLLSHAESPIGALQDVDNWLEAGRERPKQQKGRTAQTSGHPSGGGPSRNSTGSAVDEEASIEEVSVGEKVSSEKGKSRGGTPPSVRDEAGSLFEKSDPSSLSFTEECIKANSKEPTRLGINIEKAKISAPEEQDIAPRPARRTPSLAIFPHDAVGMRRLSTYFDRFYKPKGSETDPEEIHRQQEVREYFKGIPRRRSQFPTIIHDGET